MAIAISNSDTLLKSCQKLEEAIKTLIPTATGIQKEVQISQVIIHDDKTKVTSTPEEFELVGAEVKHLNLSTTIHCPAY